MNADQWYAQNAQKKQDSYDNYVSGGGTPAPKNPDYVNNLNKLMTRAKARKGCYCVIPTKILPEPPCNIFFSPTAPKQAKKIQRRHDNTVDRYRRDKGLAAGAQVNHPTPKTAGGCPDGDGNRQPHEDLCGVCQEIDGDFNNFQ